ncbi:MAG TPA: Fe-S cluster assembly protein SufD [Rhodospirillales bacterium]|nr:Fe-S cluster assembly protein SufD [Rhodospirillales bacterium]
MAAARRSIDPAPFYGEVFARERQRLPGSGRQELERVRERAFARFLELGVPTPKAEAWKYSPIARLANREMTLAEPGVPQLEEVSRWFGGGPATRRLIFLDGHLVPAVSHAGGLPAGVRVMGLARAIEEMPERVAEALAGCDPDRAFSQLNAALARSGAWIELADGVRLEEPLQLLFVHRGGGSAVMTHPRVVLRLGTGARLHLLETHAGTGAGHAFVNLVCQGELAEGAELRFDRLQLGTAGTSLLSRTLVEMAAGARFVQTAVGLGAGFLRNETEIRLGGRGGEALLSGLYMPRGEEHADTLVRVHHEAESCHSDQFFKGVVEDRAQAAFAGKIIVHRGAQKTNAYQANDNLLLSDRAEVDSKPELEIYADDVKCSHGATCGDLDESALFYLRSRGLPREVAASLLVYAFANEVIERMADERLRALTRRAVLDRVPGGTALEAEGLL